MKKKSIEEIPFGSYCYTVEEMKPIELEGEALHQHGKTLSEPPYQGRTKTVLCPYWRNTEYGMTICEFTGDQSLNEDEAGAREKVINHFGSEARFLAHWTSSELYDQVKCCGIHEEKPDFEPHLSPIFLESILAELVEKSGEDAIYRAKIRQFLVKFLDIPSKPTDDELKKHVNNYVNEWQGG